MTSSAQMKTNQENTSAAPASTSLPSHIAYYAMPVPKGQQPVLSPIGAAIAHPGGESFTLQLQLMPPVGANIIVIKAKTNNPA